MKKGLVLVMVLALMAVFATANAQTTGVFGKGNFQFSVGLTHFTAFTTDTLFSGGDPLIQSIFEQGLIGFGGEFRYGFSANWALAGGGFYGFGSNKGDFGSGGEEKIKFSSFGFRVGLDHTVNLSDETGLYMGPGFEFASAKNSIELTGGVQFDEDNDATTSLSLDGRVGVIHMLSPHVGLNGSMGKKWSYVKSSFESDIGAGPEDMSLSRWVSSVNGWAGFVFLF